MNLTEDQILHIHLAVADAADPEPGPDIDFETRTQQSEPLMRAREAQYHRHWGTGRVRHNHTTRDIQPEGDCPACDAYHAQREQR